MCSEVFAERKGRVQEVLGFLALGIDREGI